MLVINPTDEEIEAYRDATARGGAGRGGAARSSRRSRPITLDGVRIMLRANVDLPEDAELAARSGAEGVGLMRTEFLVVGRATMPDEDEQYRAYRRVVEAFEGHPVDHPHLRHRRRQAAGRRISRPRRIRSSAGAPSACASISRSCSRCSCARCCARRCTATCASCCRSSSRVDEVRAARVLLEEAARELDARGRRVSHATSRSA